MASSRDSSNSPDWKDLASILHAFQNDNKITIELALVPTVTGTTEDLRLSLVWWPVGGARQEAKPSDYLSVTCLATNRRSLESALLALLYQLDFKLALAEFDGAVRKR